MIDLLIGFALGALSAYLVNRFRGDRSGDVSTLEQRITKMVSDAMNAALADLLAAIKSQPAVTDQAAIDAAVSEKDAEDVQAVKDFQAANFPTA